ncbi:hypothetical protein [Acetobacter estunensis]|uniref:hypothetical protein n=1 Tax=Acetobacter estunensis TaxID=104097 RepID=UPI001C2D7FF8|nr:hypothetical protein [Acetobacter estunensis]MBV1837850.1 hypothetical protein [Acetobacter estunensis]
MFRTLLIVTLLSFDAFALWRGLHPHVSDTYRDYYITHTIDLPTFLAREKADLAKNPAVPTSH